MSRLNTDILIVGGGPAGIAAALAAVQHRKRITVVDENPHLGGQIWRPELGMTRSAEAVKLIAAIDHGAVEILNNTRVIFVAGERSLAAVTPEGRIAIEFHKLIITTGARERFLPFPGWTLPGVFGAGGLQALVKSGLDVKEKRVLIAGTGPLLLAVAKYLATKGAKIVGIVEQAPARDINRFALGLWRHPSKLFQGIMLRLGLRGIPQFAGSWITRVDAKGNVFSVQVGGGNSTQIECDLVACGFHLVPNTELAELIGCRIESGFVVVDEFQRTSASGVFCAGEPTGIGGVEASVVEGTIAGHAAAGSEADAARSLAKLEKSRRFKGSIDRTFKPREELRTLAEDETVVCRCEDVQYGKLADFASWRTAKLQTRCGMGPCQGRICGPAVEFLFGWKKESVRPPLFPVRMENL